ncbi:MAG TPA: AI-2E family transporter [Bryobacteraceae bacterium]
MLGLDRRALQVAWTLFVFAAVVALVYAVRRTLVIFALALFFAHLLAPLVEFVSQSFSARISRTLALTIVYILFVGVLITVMVPLGQKVAEEAAALANKIPETIKQDPLANVPIPSWLEPYRARISQLVRDRIDELGANVLPFVSRAGSQILSGIGNVLSFVLIPILSFFFLKDGAAMRAAIVDNFDTEKRPVIDDIFADLHLLLAQYIRALVLLSIAAFIFYVAFLAIAGAPYPVLLAGTAASLEFIPVIGPLIGGVLILLVAMFSGYPHLLWIFLFLVFYRIFQDYVLSPYLMSAGVEIHPLLVLFGVLAGEQLAGVPGIFFSVPVIAALRVILLRLRRRHHEL